MKRFSAVLTLILIAAVSANAFAGEGKCTASTQECLDKYAAKLQTSGWAGFEGEYDDESGIYTLTAVTADSPAAAAGFKAGDELFAFNGVKFASMSEEDWGKTAKQRMPGATVKYTLNRHHHEKTLEVTLVDMPGELIASKIGKHMIEHATVASVQ